MDASYSADPWALAELGPDTPEHVNQNNRANNAFDQANKADNTEELIVDINPTGNDVMR